LNSTTKHPRPLSPFMSYRWQYTNTLSILNRITGVVLTAGLLPLVYWLVAAASGEAAYGTAQRFFAFALVKFALVVFSFSFFFHLANGIRHLVWDTGRGLERKAARLSGWIAFTASLILTLVFWLLVARNGGAA
jgi:succinate dehydrogenase / fumarate reductase, cytochrome b subunit